MNAPDEPTVPVQPSSSRRKLIRAGFAVPAIATVASGSALAATSATCLQRQFNPHAAGFYPPVTDANSSLVDTYMRVELGKRVTGVGNAAPTYYVDGNNLQALLDNHNPALHKNASYLIGPGSYQVFNVATNQESGSLLTSKPAGGTYTQAGGKFAVLRFGSDGKIIGVGKATHLNQNAVQLSCWSSLAPQ